MNVLDYLFEYLLFLAQAVTVVVALGVVLSLFAAAGARRQAPSGRGYLVADHLNEDLRSQRDFLRETLLDKQSLKALQKQERKAEKARDRKAAKDGTESKDRKIEQDGAVEAGQESAPESVPDDPLTPLVDPLPGTPRLFVLDFEGDLQATQAEQLRREVSALLTVASAEDSVLVRLESPGGVVHGYGLAAAQLARLRDRGLKLTVAVDKVAASGGYMMAAVANEIIAAPFAVVGSIGVVAQVPNVHRLLKKNDVDVDVLTAGKFKRTLTVFGENTDEGRAKFIEELEVTHQLFQDHIGRYRPALDLDAVATGEAWYGSKALELKLIDRVATSDDALLAACRDHEVYLLRWKQDRRPLDRLLDGAQSLFRRTTGTRWGALRTAPTVAPLEDRLGSLAESPTTGLPAHE